MLKQMRSVVIGGTLVLMASAAGAQTAAPATAPTFTKDVAPIFQEKCEACHRPDSIAPMSLVTYAETRPWARSIKARVADKQMPPVAHRQDGRRAELQERPVALRQADRHDRQVGRCRRAAGEPEGHARAEDVARGSGLELRAAVRTERADLIVKSYEFTMPAVSQDAWDKRVTPSGITEPRWVRAIEIRPATIKGRKIVHHAIAYLDQTDPNAPSGGFGLPTPFMEWAVGKQGELMRPDTGKLLLPGSKFRWDIHYSQAGEEITNSVEMGIYFYPKGQEPKFRNTLSLVPAALGTLDIRPNTLSLVEGFTQLRDNARIESYQPHMHLRGKAMMVEAILPNGQKQVISLVSDFNFNWMTTYVYDDNVAPLLPKGTLLKVTAWHDNTSARKSNPDPNQWVGWGDRTVDEMAHAWINIVYMKDEDYKAEQDKRRAAATSAPAPQQQQ
jgi:hypothetical protein